MRKSITAAALVSVLALAGCSAPATGGGAGGESVTVDTPIGAPEKTELTIALSAPNVDSQAPVHIAMDKGFYEEEGLTIKIIDADNIREGLVGGSLDLGVDNTIDLIDAAVAGTGLKIVAGYRAREPFLLAASADIKNPADLEGKQVILGDAPGTPIIDVRLKELAKAGFDLDGVGYQAVFPPGFSNAWVENFVADQVKLTPLFPRHIPIIEEAGGHFVLNEMMEWPNDSLATSEKWVEANPNTLARFIRATTKGIEIYKDLSQQEYVQTLMAGKDFKVTEAELDPEIYAYGPALYDENMMLNQASFDDALEAFGMETPEWTSYVDELNLTRAMAELTK